LKLENIPLYVWHGLKALNWFDECEATIIKLVGPDDCVLFAKCLAATSMNNYLLSNVTQARKAFYQIKNELPFSKLGLILSSNICNWQKRAKDFRGEKRITFGAQ
jgi:hypothetical protein